MTLAHLAFEEEVVFPAFAKQSAECTALVKRLVGEHAAIRELLDENGIAIQRIYPWIELESRAWSDSTVAGAAEP